MILEVLAEETVKEITKIKESRQDSSVASTAIQN